MTVNNKWSCSKGVRGMKRKSLALVLSIILLSNGFSVYASGSDDSLNNNEKVQKLIGENYIQGYGNGDFGYNNSIKRSEITRLIVLAGKQQDKIEELKNTRGNYSDVGVRYWANGEINVGTSIPTKKSGKCIINGYPNGTFLPEKGVSYAELSKMLVVLAKSDLDYGLLSDEKASWPNDWIKWAEELGINNDIINKDPNEIVNREDAFVMFSNALEIRKDLLEDELYSKNQEISSKQVKLKKKKSSKNKNERQELESEEKVDTLEKLKKDLKVKEDRLSKVVTLLESLREEAEVLEEEIRDLREKISDIENENTRAELRVSEVLDINDDDDFSNDGKVKEDDGANDSLDLEDLKSLLEDKESRLSSINEEIESLKLEESSLGIEIESLKKKIRVEEVELARINFENNARKITHITSGSGDSLVEADVSKFHYNSEKDRFEISVDIKGLEFVGKDHIESLVGNKSGLFSEILPSLGVKAVYFGDDRYSVDINDKDFNIKKLIDAALKNLNSNGEIFYSADIKDSESSVEYSSDFLVSFSYIVDENIKNPDLDINSGDYISNRNLIDQDEDVIAEVNSINDYRDNLINKTVIAASKRGRETETFDYSYSDDVYEIKINKEKNETTILSANGKGIATGIINFLTISNKGDGDVAENLVEIRIMDLKDRDKFATIDRKQLISMSKNMSIPVGALKYLSPDNVNIGIMTHLGDLIGIEARIDYIYKLESSDKQYVKTEKYIMTNNYIK